MLNKENVKRNIIKKIALKFNKPFDIEKKNYFKLISRHFENPRFSRYKIYVGRNKLHIRGVRSSETSGESFPTKRIPDGL